MATDCGGHGYDYRRRHCYLALAPRKYTAYADMVIDTKRVTFSQSELATENRIVEDASVESEIETTKSERVAGVVAKRLNLITDPEFIGTGESLKQHIFSLFQSSAPTPEPSKEDLLRGVIGRLRGNLNVTRIGRSYIEQIAYTSLDPNKAAMIANAFADAYIEDQLEAKFEATRRASIWLEQRIGDLRKQASDAFMAVQDFKSQNGIIIGPDGKLASDIELDQLGIALAKGARRNEPSQGETRSYRARACAAAGSQQGKLQHSRSDCHRCFEQSGDNQASTAIFWMTRIRNRSGVPAMALTIRPRET